MQDLGGTSVFEVRPTLRRALFGATILVPGIVAFVLIILTIVQVLGCGWHDLRNTHTWKSLQDILLFLAGAGAVCLLDCLIRCQTHWVVSSDGVNIYRRNRLVRTLPWAAIKGILIKPLAIEIRTNNRSRNESLYWTQPAYGEEIKRRLEAAASNSQM